MNFELSDDARGLGEQARRFLTEQAGPAAARRAMNGEDTRSLNAQVYELGWHAVRVPEAHGGLGLSFEELAVLAEEAGRALLPTGLLSNLGVVEAMLLCGEAGEYWLPFLAAGDLYGCVAWSEGSGGPGAMPATRLEAGRLTGVKRPVADGMSANLAVVTVAGPDGPELVALDLHENERTFKTAVETLDLVRPSAELRFEGSEARRLGGNAEWNRLLDRLAVLASFEAIGTATAAMDMTVAYAKERVAFGQRIGRYQGVKHRLAEMYIKLELARAHALHAVASIEGENPELAQAAAAARVASLDALSFAAEECVQLHGGIGFTWDHDAQFYYRRARQLAAQYGARRFWVERLVRALERRNRAAA